MGLKYTSIMKLGGIVLTLTGLAMIPALLTSLSCREFGMAFFFSLCVIPAVALGGILRLSRRKRPPLAMKPRDAIFIASLCWVASSLAGALPYAFSGAAGVADAFFESASGFTTTGATVFRDIDALPKGLLVWRSTSGWLGGLSILVLVLGALPISGAAQLTVQAEPSASLSERFLSKTHGTARQILAIYMGMTLLLLALLLLAGMDVFGAFIHAMGVASTSGFTRHTAEAVGFEGAGANWILTVFMLLAAMSYSMYSKLLSKHWRQALQDEEPRWFLTMFVAAGLFLALGMSLAPTAGAGDFIVTADGGSGAAYAMGGGGSGAAYAMGGDGSGATYAMGGGTATYGAAMPSGLGRRLELAFFESAATISTTGLRNVDYTLWPTFCHLILLFLMVSGGCSASSAGGLKALRVAIVFKLLRRNISRRMHPNAVVQIKMNGVPLSSETSSAMAGHALLYLAVVFLGTAALCADGTDVLTSASSVISCLGNVGPAFGAAGPASCYDFFSPYIKVLLGFIMIAGRLELATLILLFTPQFWSNS
ncbi:MAG: TrkH family potassium uptake protein [Clostridiales Family XIII bacterium]|jgi:trk system potassium uptake protein TrkH|nr:TrkH family potassium uptake protein [Clostridiales Family XIII bacterium]